MTEITIKQILPNITTYKYVSKKSIQINKLCMYDATSVIYQMTISGEKEKKSENQSIRLISCQIRWHEESDIKAFLHKHFHSDENKKNSQTSTTQTQDWCQR